METHTQTVTKKRGGAKVAPGHLALLVLSTLLLTVSALLLIWDYNLVGVIALAAGIIVRFIDTRI